MGIPDIWWYHHKVEILVYAAGFSSLHRGSKLKYHHLIVIEDKLIRKLVVFCSTANLLSSAFSSCFSFVYLLSIWLHGLWIHSFQSRAGACAAPSLAVFQVWHEDSVVSFCALHFPMSWQYTLFSLLGLYAVTIKLVCSVSSFASMIFISFSILPHVLEV